MSDELKPCPFCGGEATRESLPYDEFGNGGGDVIECCKCHASSHVEFGRKENLISSWNTRTDTIPSAAYVAWLEAALRSILEAAEDCDFVACHKLARAALASRPASPDVRVVPVDSLERWEEELWASGLDDTSAEIRAIIGGQP